MGLEAPPATPDKRSTILVLVALFVATVLKLLWASHSIGSVDALIFHSFASEMEEVGLSGLYKTMPHFNHTPLTAAVIAGIYKVAKIPVDAQLASAGAKANAVAAQHIATMEMQDFVFWLRLLPIIMDVVVVLALLRWRPLLEGPPLWALLLLALSPVSLMVSGFHGNIDGVMTAFLLLAVIASVAGRVVLSAVLFAIACNVKIVPLPFAPLFFFFWLSRGAAWRFTAATVGVLLVGFLWGLLTCPVEFVRNVFGYGSYWGNWGVTLLLRLTGWVPVQELDFLKQTDTEKLIMQILKVVIVAGIAAIGWRRKHQRPQALIITFALAWLWFFSFAPGVGVQYFAWLAPFLVVAAPRAYVLHLVTATIFLVTFYHTTADGSFPWRTAVPRIYEHPAWSITGGICWLTLVAILAVKWRAWWRLERAQTDTTPEGALLPR